MKTETVRGLGIILIAIACLCNTVAIWICKNQITTLQEKILLTVQ